MPSESTIALPQANIRREAQFRSDILAGLGGRPKQLPCKYLYDERGSRLFDQICELEEYYLTRTELAIMEQNAAEMADWIGRGVMLVEYGSGSGVKTQILLAHLREPAAYVPVDISGKHLRAAAQGLAADFPEIEVLPVCADFTGPVRLPQPVAAPSHAAVYFPGSTIGNFSPGQAVDLLRGIAALCGPGGGLLIGFDLQKAPSVIEAAYNDRQGVTAAFNLNLLSRINRELAGTFDVDAFRHEARYNAEAGRVEISLVSQSAQNVWVDGYRFSFALGERMLTEYSHKYTIAGFAEMARRAGLTLRQTWTDGRAYFAVAHLVVEG